MTQVLYTVDSLVDEVRSQLDELNTDTVSTERDILPTLNRAQDYAFDVYARLYPEPILKYSTLSLVGGQAEYSLPDDTFEDRILKLEITIPSGAGLATQREVQRVSFSDITDYESASTSNTPFYYCIIGRKIRFVSTPSGTYNARMWYLRNPDKLVKSQGRITVVNSNANYVIVDSVGDELTTETDQLGSYVNVINGETGEVKGSLQIISLNENKIAFRTVPSRSSVATRSITGSLSSLNVEQDDYICSVSGTCVPYFSKPTSNFLIQYSVAEITRKLGGDARLESEILDKFEKQIERTWVGREQSLRVSKKSPIWGKPTRRWYWE